MGKSGNPSKATATEQVNRLAKWRSLLSGWVLGTKADNAPGVQGMRDLQEARLLMRAELNAVAALCIARNVFTADELTAVFGEAAEDLSRALSAKFPGVKATDYGLQLDAKTIEADGWPSRLGFPK